MPQSDFKKNLTTLQISLKKKIPLLSLWEEGIPLVSYQAVICYSSVIYPQVIAITNTNCHVTNKQQSSLMIW